MEKETSQIVMALAIIIAAMAGFVGVGVYRAYKADQEEGPLHCGFKRTIGLDGQDRYEKACWREKVRTDP